VLNNGKQFVAALKEVISDLIMLLFYLAKLGAISKLSVSIIVHRDGGHVG
jgi:hypothetical protein